MSSQVARPLYAFILVGLVAALLPIGARTASASSEPPFDVFFPQEPSVTQFSSTFGAARSGGRRHKGTDLIAPKMTEVYAVADGTIIYVGINNLSGRNVRIEHAGGWTSHYVHLNNDNIGTDDGSAPWTLTVAPGIEEGATVVAGQLIGWVGDSGNAEGTTAHTHFEIRDNGVAIDPYDLLVDAYVRSAAHEEWLEAKIAGEPVDYPIE